MRVSEREREIERENTLMKSCNQVVKLATRNETAKLVLTNGKRTFNKTGILKIVEDSREEFASEIGGGLK